jgi:hypothetical protein
VIRDLAQRYALEVQIKRCSHYARVIPHAFKAYIEDELSRTRFAPIDLFIILLAVLDNMDRTAELAAKYIL